MAGLAADVPLRGLLCADVIADGVTAIAGWPRGTLEITRGVIGGPPIGAGVCDVVRTPGLVADVPLDRKRIIVVAGAGEVALLPLTPVDEGDLIEGKGRDLVRSQIRNDRVGMFARVTHDV